MTAFLNSAKTTGETSKPRRVKGFSHLSFAISLGLSLALISGAIRSESAEATHRLLKKTYSLKEQSTLYDTSHLEALNRNKGKRRISQPSATHNPIIHISHVVEEICTTERTYRQNLEIMARYMIPRIEEDQRKLAQAKLPVFGRKDREEQISDDLDTLAGELSALRNRQETLIRILNASKAWATALADHCPENSNETPKTLELWDTKLLFIAQALSRYLELSKFDYDQYIFSYEKLNKPGDRKLKTAEAQELEFAREKEFKALRPQASHPKFSDLSITPLQRIPRLLLLLGDLLKTIPKEEAAGPGFQELVNAQQKATRIVLAINAHKNILEESERKALEKKRELLQPSESEELNRIDEILQRNADAQALYYSEFLISSSDSVLH